MAAPAPHMRRPPLQLLGLLVDGRPIHRSACILIVSLRVYCHRVRSRVITSSTVMAPTGRPETSTTAKVLRLYLSNSVKTSFSFASGVTETTGSDLSSTSGSSSPASSNRPTATSPENFAVGRLLLAVD